MIDIKTLKSNLDLVSLLRQRGIHLERKGKNYFISCVFHPGDRTPSLSIDPETQLWSCFACGAGGDVFSFFQQLDKVPFVEVVKKLCKHDIQERDLVDLNLERDGAPQQKAVDRPSQEILDRIVAFWQKSFAASRDAQAYVKRRRIWSPEILKALKIGYSNGRLRSALPEDGKLRRQLKDLGILNEAFNEVFYQRLVVPLFDETGVLVGVYGRTINPKSDLSHLYLKGPRRGAFNPAGIPEGGPVMLAESIVDALTLLTMGFTPVTCAFGVNGFTADLRKLLVVRQVKQVICLYDADDVGNHAAEQLAFDLAGHGIEVLRVELPTKDVNELAMNGGTKADVEALIAKARKIPVLEATSATHPDSAGVSAASDPLTFTFGERTYVIDGDPERGPRKLLVGLKVTGYGKKPFTDEINLYADRARATLIGRLNTVFRGKVEKKELEEDLFAILDELEKLAPPDDETDVTPVMTPREEREAEAFLGRSDLIALILEDIAQVGVVGEEDNKLLAYLVATSRKLKKPLSLSVISRSSAGKSWLLNRAVDLMPPEEVLRYTRMSPRALFYDEPGRFKHKILFIEEAIGAKDADLGVRSMQSEKRLANLATMTDPKTGKLKTQENVVEGPLTYLTSSTEPLDDETESRSFEVAIDESSQQTQRIVTSLFQERTLEGIQADLGRDEILRRHRNAQRRLEPVLVANPYIPQLKFPTGSLQLRREADKYLSLIETVAFLHQKQRPVKNFRRDAETIRYIEVARSDVAVANPLMVKCLARALSSLPGPAQELLIQIRNHAMEKAQGGDLLDVRFTRREIQEKIGWTSTRHLLSYLEILVKGECVAELSGAFGKQYVYTLSPHHQLVVQSGLTVDEMIRALGLTPAEDLVDPLSKRP